MKKVKLGVTLEQAEVIKEALEWSARTAIGQMDSNHLPHDIAKDLKGILHPDLRASKGFNHSEFSRNCCSMKKMLAVKLQEHRYKDEENKPQNVNNSFIDIYKVPVIKVEIDA